MHRARIAGAAFAVVLVTIGLGSCSMMQSQAEAEIKALLASLTASGAKVSHGAITTSVWSRTVAVENLDIQPTADGSTAITIARIEAEGINPSGRGSAQRVVVTDLVITDRSAKDAAPLIKAPRVELTDVAYVPSALATRPTDPVVRAVLAFAALKARTITAPSIATSFSMLGAPPRPNAPAPVVRVDYTYTDIHLDGVADGRVALAKIAKGVIGGATGSPIVSGVIDNMEMADVDILPMFEMGLERRKPDGPMYKVQGKVSLGPYTVKTVDGGDVTIGRMSGDGVWIDPAKVSYGHLQTFIKQAEAMQGGGANPQQTAAFVASLAEVYEGLRMDSVVLDDMTAKGPGPAGTFTMARFAMLGLDGGKLGAFRLEGLAGKVPGKRGMEPLNISLFAFEKLDIAGLMRLSLAGMRNPQMKPDEILSKVMPLLQGLELNGFEFPDQQTGQPVRIDKSKISWGAFINGLPSQMKVAVRGQMPLNGNDPRAVVFVQNGIRAIDVDMELAARYDDKTRQLLVDPFIVAGAPLGTLSAKLGLVNVPREVFTTNAQQAQAAMLSVDLSELELDIKDGGVISLARKIAGPSFGDGIVAALRQQAGQDTPTQAAVFAHVGQFLSESGQTLTLRFKPKAVSRLSEIAAQVMLGGPAAMFSALDVTSSVKR